MKVAELSLFAIKTAPGTMAAGAAVAIAGTGRHVPASRTRRSFFPVFQDSFRTAR